MGNTYELEYDSLPWTFEHKVDVIHFLEGLRMRLETSPSQDAPETQLMMNKTL